MKKSLIAAMVLAALASGCGGSSGGDSTPEPQNQAPVIDPPAASTVDEQTEVSLSVTASDADGTIASYSWNTEADLELSGADTSTVTFTAPEVKEDTAIQLTVAVKDDAGATAYANVTVNVNQVIIPLTIKGVATDSPLAGATITIYVDGEPLPETVTADSEGGFEAPLMFDDTQSGAIISMKASGTGDQANAELFTWMGTVSDLASDAGEDGQLTANENFDVNITNITTAEYGLAVASNQGTTFASDDAFKAAQSALVYDEVVALATAMKVAIDKSAANPELALPDEIATTLDLALDQAAARSYLWAIRDSEAFTSARQEILDDPMMFDKASDWSVPESLYITPASPLEGMLFNIFRFANDGTGRQGDNLFNWTQEGNKLTIDVHTPEVWAYYWPIEYGGPEIRVEERVQEYIIERLGGDDGFEQIQVTTTRERTYPDGEKETEVETWDYVTKATRTEGMQKPAVENIRVGYLPMLRLNGVEIDGDVERLTFTSSFDKLTFNEDGTGNLLYRDEAFTWSETDDTLRVAIGNDYVVDYRIAAEGTTLDIYSYETTDAGERDHQQDFVNYGLIMDADTQNDVWSSASIPGYYTFEAVKLPESQEHFWFELRENGEADTFYAADHDNDGTIEKSEVQAHYGLWSVESDGRLKITSALGENRMPTPDCRSGDTEGCISRDSRHLELLKKEGEQYSISHMRHYSPEFYVWEAQYQHLRMINKVAVAPFDVGNAP